MRRGPSQSLRVAGIPLLPAVRIGALGLLMLAAGCGDGRDPTPAPGDPEPGGQFEAQSEIQSPTREVFSRDAQLDVARTLREDLELRHAPSDGGGRAWLVAPSDGPREPLRAGEPARIALTYEAGPLGIAAGGALYLQISPFWGWDDPQDRHPDAPGYTTALTEAVGVDLKTLPLGPSLLAIEIHGRALATGEQIRIVYGAGAAGARVDEYAEREERLWLAVDGDGDGTRSLLENSPQVDVVAGAPAALALSLPSSARPGSMVPLVIAVVDRRFNSGVQHAGDVVLEATDGLDVPERITLQPEDHGRLRIESRVRKTGVHRVSARLEGAGFTISAESNPLIVHEEAERILWADLHGHSQLSDGTGTPEDYFDYARNVSGLDVVALTDHDHWGMRFLDANPALWERIRNATRSANSPGQFVTLLGYEWTSWLHGHRHVLYFAHEGEIFSSIDTAFESPPQLWRALAGRPALTFAHHSAGGPISTNWHYAPDPELEPVTEITSVHGSSESIDSPAPIYNPVRGNFVRDALDHGYRFGFIGSGDGHDGHPGLAHRGAGPGSGGLAAILSEKLTRDALLEALRSRRVYATSGPRISLRVRLDDQPMGSEVPGVREGVAQDLEMAVSAPSPIDRLELVRGHSDPTSPPGEIVHTLSGEGGRDWEGTLSIPGLAAGEYLYVRAVLENSHAAWSSPFYASAPQSPQSESQR